MEAAYRRIAVAAKNIDTREHDIADSDDYFQYHGGMVATVRALTGTAPAAYIGDSTRPEAVRTRTLHEETSRVFRARVVNPRWMDAMRRHGYKGAFELAATVDYLFGYDATTGVVADWMYEKLTADLRAGPGEPRVPGGVQPVGAARHRRTAAGGGRPRHVGAPRGGHAGRAAAGVPGDRGRPRRCLRSAQLARTVLVIGIGAGDPEHLTLQAAAAIGRAEVFFEIDKGVPDLAGLRATLLARHARPDHRVVTAPEVPRDRDPADYPAEVATWQAARADAYAAMIEAELPPGGVGAFLVWGDPALYDGTLRLLHGVAPDLNVVSIPGISSVQALAAAHGLILNRVGEPVLITTGRRLAERGMPADVPDVVVMLDGRCAFAGLPDTDLDIYWGAYLGTPRQLLIAGDLRAVADEIVERRAAARAAAGWIMDTYLLRRRTLSS